MLRRTLSSLVPIVASSESKLLSDQENEINFDLTNFPAPSPNRSKYEGKFGEVSERRPLKEKTKIINSNANKVNSGNKKNNEIECKVKISKHSASVLVSEDDKTEIKTDENNEKIVVTNLEKKISNRNSSEMVNNSNSSVSFEDLFHLSNSDNVSTSKIDELSMALSDTLKENEQLHDTISLLKAEIDRLNGELLECKEYAELYLLGKELIENQGEEIENLKKKLINNI